MTTVLQVENLAKHYGDLKAVAGVSFGVDGGTCFGLLGPNGAGKTTTIEMIEDITPPLRVKFTIRATGGLDRFVKKSASNFSTPPF